MSRYPLPMDILRWEDCPPDWMEPRKRAMLLTTFLPEYRQAAQEPSEDATGHCEGQGPQEEEGRVIGWNLTSGRVIIATTGISGGIPPKEDEYLFGRSISFDGRPGWRGGLAWDLEGNVLGLYLSGLLCITYGLFASLGTLTFFPRAHEHGYSVENNKARNGREWVHDSLKNTKASKMVSVCCVVGLYMDWLPGGCSLVTPRRICACGTFYLHLPRT